MRSQVGLVGRCAPCSCGSRSPPCTQGCPAAKLRHPGGAERQGAGWAAPQRRAGAAGHAGPGPGHLQPGLHLVIRRHLLPRGWPWGSGWWGGMCGSGAPWWHEHGWQGPANPRLSLASPAQCPDTNCASFTSGCNCGSCKDGFQEDASENCVAVRCPCFGVLGCWGRAATHFEPPTPLRSARTPTVRHLPAAVTAAAAKRASKGMPAENVLRCVA